MERSSKLQFNVASGNAKLWPVNNNKNKNNKNNINVSFNPDEHNMLFMTI